MSVLERMCVCLSVNRSVVIVCSTIGTNTGWLPTINSISIIFNGIRSASAASPETFPIYQWSQLLGPCSFLQRSPEDRRAFIRQNESIALFLPLCEWNECAVDTVCKWRPLSFEYWLDSGAHKINQQFFVIRNCIRFCQPKLSWIATKEKNGEQNVI